MRKRRRQGPSRPWQTSRTEPSLDEWSHSKDELLKECKEEEGDDAPIATCLEQIYLYPCRFWQILDGFSDLPTVEQNCLLSPEEVSALRRIEDNEAFSKRFRVYVHNMKFNSTCVHFVYFHFGRQPPEICTATSRQSVSRHAEAWLTATVLGVAMAEAIRSRQRPAERLISPSEVLHGLKRYYENFRNRLLEKSPTSRVLDDDGMIIKPTKREWLGWLPQSLHDFVMHLIIPLQQTDAKLVFDAPPRTKETLTTETLKCSNNTRVEDAFFPR